MHYCVARIRTIGANRREHGQDSCRHDGRRKSPQWHGKMLWHLRSAMEKVSGNIDDELWSQIIIIINNF